MAVSNNSYERIVVKLGTNLLTNGSDRLDLGVMASLVSQVARLHKQGLEVILVTSGAVAAGRYRLRGMAKEDLPQRQALAAVGQSALMHAYDELFAWHDVTVAQALVTRRDLVDRAGYLNVRNTLNALLDARVVPIINENDVVATDEIEGARFGDNDNLSAMVANLVDADLLTLLTDIDGLYTANPKEDPTATLVPRVDAVTPEIEALALGAGSSRGTGGMITKLQAAKLATASGVAVIIARGAEPDVLLRLARGEALGTLFPPATTKLESRKRWMLSGVARRGSVTVDDGAAKAVCQGRSSLLPVGVREIRGPFKRGDIVDIMDLSGKRLASGIVNYDSTDLAKLKGHRSSEVEQLLGYAFGDEVVHRNNLVLV